MFRSALAVAAALVLMILWGTMSVSPVLAQTAPDAPTAVLANPGDGEITLTWENSATGITAHRMRINVVPESGADPVYNRLNLPAEPLSYTFDELPNNGGPVTNGTTYEIVLKARNDDGFSEWSEPVQVTAGAPVQTVITNIWPYEIAIWVSWRPPEDNGDELPASEVQYKLATESSYTDTSGELGGNTSGYYIFPFTTGETYDVRVRAKNSRGWGPWAEAQQMTVGVPWPVGPTANPGNGEITLTWNEPGINGSSITGYGLRYRVRPTDDDDDPEAGWSD